LLPFVLGLFQHPGFNEFAPQLNRSLYDRLLRSGFPVAVLLRQRRMHPKLVAFPSRFTYLGRMKNDQSVRTLDMDPDFQRVLLNWLLVYRETIL
jgi:superfamily I DNA and/or RNA helicase